MIAIYNDVSLPVRDVAARVRVRRGPACCSPGGATAAARPRRRRAGTACTGAAALAAALMSRTRGPQSLLHIGEYGAASAP